MRAGEAQWASVSIFEYTTSRSLGEDALDVSVRRHVGLSPWAATPRECASPPREFVETRDKATLIIAGTSVACDRAVWKHEVPEGHSKRGVDSIVVWTDPGHRVAAFKCPLPIPILGGVVFPAHCLLYEIRPLGADDIFGKIEWVGSQPRTIGGRALTVARYRFSIDNLPNMIRRRSPDPRKGALAGTFELYGTIPGGLVSFEETRSGNYVSTQQITLSSWAEAPLPEGIQAFDHGSFGFVAPPPLRQVPAQPGEVCRFEHNAAFIAVSVFELADKDFEVWSDGFGEALRRQNYGAALEVGFRHPSLQCLAASYSMIRVNVGHSYFAHQGRGYHVSFSGFHEMDTEQQQDLLVNWRWPVRP